MSALREIRKSAGIKQGDLAKKIGILQPAISRYETGKRELPVETAKKLSEVLGVPWTKFFE